ncbi:MAG: hypothetical protein ABI857_00875 [Acidobacteriota bacterium]
MTNSQRTQNPDVNSYTPDAEPFGNADPTNNRKNDSQDIERKSDTDVIPVPPDVNPGAPVEEPPDTNSGPMATLTIARNALPDERG